MPQMAEFGYRLVPGEDEINRIDDQRGVEDSRRQIALVRRRRQMRASGFVSGWPGSENHRVETANAGSTRNSRPAVNFESSAPARLSAKSRTFRGFGSRHIPAKVHSASSENSVIGTSVSTSGTESQKSRSTHIDSQAEQATPWAAQPASRTCRAPSRATRVRSNIGNRAQASVEAGSFQVINSQWPNTHSPRKA